MAAVLDGNARCVAQSGLKWGALSFKFVEVSSLLGEQHVPVRRLEKDIVEKVEPKGEIVLPILEERAESRNRPYDGRAGASG